MPTNIYTMGKHKNKNIKAGINTETKADYQKPSNQWRVIFKNVSQDFYTGWLPNYIVTIVFVLCAPAIGLLMNTPKAIIIGVASGITIAVWAMAFIMIRHIPTPNQATQPSNLEPPKSPSPPIDEVTNSVPQSTEPPKLKEEPKVIEPLRVTFRDSMVCNVSLSSSYQVLPERAPGLIANFGTFEQAEAHLRTVIESSAFAVLERLTYGEVQKSRTTVEGAILESARTEASQAGFMLHAVKLGKIVPISPSLSRTLRPQLEDIHTKILTTVGDSEENGLTLDSLCDLFEMKRTKMVYYLETLQRMKLIDRIESWEGKIWYELTSQGRKVLVENDLI